MIITKPKDRLDLLQIIKKDPVFLVGCSECATICHTGGEPEVQELQQFLEENNIEVTGNIILDPACHLLNDRRLLKPVKQQVEKAKKIVVLSCGTGVQTVSELHPNKQIISGTDTLFLAEIKRAKEFERRCNLCGECVLDVFGGICPVTCCPKTMLNGPCGGSKDGKCEVNNKLKCVWEEVYQRFKDRGQLDRLRVIQPPKDWSKSTEFIRSI